MHNVVEEWEEINRDYFTTKANVLASFYLKNGTTPIVGTERFISLSILRSGDLFSGVLPQDEITFTFDNTDGRFAYDPENDYYFKTQVDLFAGFDRKGRPGHTLPSSVFWNYYFISNVETDSSGLRTTFTAKTKLAFMTARAELQYSYGTGYEIAVQVIHQAEEDSNVPGDTIKYVFDYDALSAVYISILDDENYTMAEVLQLVANASKCLLFVGNDGAIHIERYGKYTENYVIGNKLCYKHSTIKYNDKISAVDVVYSHGAVTEDAYVPGEKNGGKQIVTNPILINDNEIENLAQYVLKTINERKKTISGVFRGDPRIDLFDLVVVPEKDKVNAVCLTKVNMSFNGAWKCEFTGVVLPDVTVDLRICDLEMLTIRQAESLRIEQLDKNTISASTGEFLATKNGELAYWEGDD